MVSFYLIQKLEVCAQKTFELPLYYIIFIERRHPNIAKVGTIGSSTEGRALVYIKISANVTRRSHLEPMFKYVGNMHGDETVG